MLIGNAVYEIWSGPPKFVRWATNFQNLTTALFLVFFYWRRNNLRRSFPSLHQCCSVSLTSRSLICMKVIKDISNKTVAVVPPYSIVARWPQSEHLFLFPYWINTPSTGESTWMTKTSCYHCATTRNGDMSKRTFLPEIHWIPFRPIHCAWKCPSTASKNEQRTGW